MYHIKLVLEIDHGLQIFRNTGNVFDWISKSLPV